MTEHRNESAWIDVCDRLPDPSWPETVVLVCNGLWSSTEGYYDEFGKVWRFENDNNQIQSPLAWQPKPYPSRHEFNRFKKIIHYRNLKFSDLQKIKNDASYLQILQWFERGWYIKYTRNKSEKNWFRYITARNRLVYIHEG